MISRRGLFGLVAAAPFAPLASVARDTSWTKEEAEAEAARYEEEALEEDEQREGYELARVFWFNSIREYGYLQPAHAKYRVFLKKKIVEAAGYEKVEPRQLFWVHWKLTTRGPTAVLIRAA